MDDELYLAIDQGGHASRVIVFDHKGSLVTQASINIGTTHDQNGHIEHDPDEMIASLKSALDVAIENLGDRKKQIKSAGLATQRSSIVCWDRETGEPLSPIISWQDRRAAPWIKQFEEHTTIIHQKTGLFPNAHYGVSKLRWCLDHLPRVSSADKSGRLVFGPMASFLLFHLVEIQPLFIDSANASRTLLWNCQNLDWDHDLSKLFGIPLNALPACVTTRHQFGNINYKGLQIPLTIMNGDQSAALFAFGEPQERICYINIGTGAFVQQVLDKYQDDADKLLTSVVWADDKTIRYVLEGTVNGAGSALTEIGKSLGINSIEIEASIEKWLKQVKDPPLFLNGVSGLGAPFWVSDFTSQFVQEGKDSEKIVGVLESIVFLINENLNEMKKYLNPPQQIFVSGGLSSLDGLCQRLADLTQKKVYRPEESEATARGIAWLQHQPQEWPEAAPGKQFFPVENNPLKFRYQRWKIALHNAL